METQFQSATIHPANAGNQEEYVIKRRCTPISQNKPIIDSFCLTVNLRDASTIVNTLVAQGTARSLSLLAKYHTNRPTPYRALRRPLLEARHEIV